MFFSKNRFPDFTSSSSFLKLTGKQNGEHI